MQALKNYETLSLLCSKPTKEQAKVLLVRSYTRNGRPSPPGLPSSESAPYPFPGGSVQTPLWWPSSPTCLTPLEPLCSPGWEHSQGPATPTPRAYHRAESPSAKEQQQLSNSMESSRRRQRLGREGGGPCRIEDGEGGPYPSPATGPTEPASTRPAHSSLLSFYRAWGRGPGQSHSRAGLMLCCCHPAILLLLNKGPWSRLALGLHSLACRGCVNRESLDRATGGNSLRILGAGATMGDSHSRCRCLQDAGRWRWHCLRGHGSRGRGRKDS